MERAPISEAPRPLPSLSTTSWPDLGAAFPLERAALLEALDRSLEWFDRPSSRERYPVAGLTHRRVFASVFAFRQLLARAADRRELETALRAQFELHASRGGDGRGAVLFTGYYAPVFDASRDSTDRCGHPLYRRPDDLVIDSTTGETLGRRVGGEIEPYPGRRQIEETGMLSGQELVWMCDPFDAYVVHIQGSAMLSLPDGSHMRVAYAGDNGREYTSVARLLVADGVLGPTGLSLEAVRGYFARYPDELDRYLRRNERFIFFRETESTSWPEGSLGLKLTPLHSLATDKRIFPPGAVTLVVTVGSDGRGGRRPLVRFMVDQDTGGAIRGPGRADIYYGVGSAAEDLAGAQYAEGRLYYLVLKEDRVSDWADRLAGQR